jgi:hypothetical protein
MDEGGKFTPVATGKISWQQKVEMQPREVVFWVLR